MTTELIQTKKLTEIKKHIVPSVISASVALMVAIPLTATLSGNSSLASADSPQPNSCNVQSASAQGSNNVNNVKPAVTTASITRDISAPASALVSHAVTSTNTTSNGNGNTNGNGAQTNGNTGVNNGLVGVNAFPSVSVLNGSLNDVASHDNILSGNTVDLSSTVNAVTNLVSGDNTGLLGGLGL